MDQSNFPKKITDKFLYSFFVEKSGLYAIVLSASCDRGSDLRVEIDSFKLREIPPLSKPQYNNIPPSWNGARLQGLEQIVIFILEVGKGAHILTFFPTGEAIIEKPKIISIDHKEITFKLNEQAEYGDRRPWLTIALLELPIKSITGEITLKWHLGDSDDVKFIIDNLIQKNSLSVLHRNWVWSGNFFKKLFGIEKSRKIFTANLPRDTHYLEFWADRMPILHEVILDLGISEFKRTPSVINPEWTGDFDD